MRSLFRRRSPRSVSVDNDYTDVLGTTPQFPHCDTLILHTPGVCVYCDRHPDWQQYRSAIGMAFSDMPADRVLANNLLPCPSTAHRPAEVRDRWYGNQPR